MGHELQIYLANIQRDIKDKKVICKAGIDDKWDIGTEGQKKYVKKINQLDINNEQHSPEWM